MLNNPLRRQLPVYSPVNAQALAAALRAVLVPGADPAEQLSALLAQRFEARHADLFGSGTQALTAGIAALLQATRSSVVALPGYSCFDVATAAIGANARVALYDIDPQTLAPVWSSLEAVLERGARVAVLAPLYGIPFDWSRARGLAAHYSARLIEDAAQAAGSRWAGRRVGTFGDATVLSFGRGKGWTGGGGGALLWRDQPASAARQPTRTATEFTTTIGALAQWLLGRPSWYGLPNALPGLHLGETRYHEPAPLQAMPRFAAALVLATDAIATAEAAARCQRAKALRTRMASAVRALGASFPGPSDPVAEPGYLRLPLLLPAMDHTDLREAVRDRLAVHGVERGYRSTLQELPALQDRLTGDRQHLAGAVRLARNLVTLPTHGKTADVDIVGIEHQLNIIQ